ncbi:hypothetical protein [Catenuloplanes atrovinosus]|uniref:Membrane channel-forming protein YqfA (Hemolysin III family) n=1 Tax=Catenuloplanes atrovinosus TaxID=137266 RepID=A0AAE3YNF1_9ACTN|nr:hypothetical protein [Catenuloplanes atrovinosus]MDR7276262.1 putative membrane channel-forming protein YqfA (hemolysin III family) [Catenuloplanes atrovinosus]
MKSLTRWCLRRAAARWPEDVRAEMEREWLAELAALEAEPGTAMARLRYAVSLFASRPERGWGESFLPLTPVFALLVTALATLGVDQLADMLVMLTLRLTGPEYRLDWEWPIAIAQAVLTLLWCVAAGRWVGRRWPMRGAARFAAPFVLAPVPALPFFYDTDPVFMAGVVLGVLVWAAAAGALLLAAVRTRGVIRALLVVLGAPLAGLLAGVTGTVPVALTTEAGWRSSAASLLIGTPPAEFTVIIDLTSRPFSYLGPWALLMAGFTALALAYGLAPAVPRTARAAPAEEVDAAHGTPVIAIGAGCAAVGVVAWAYTLAILTPGMAEVAAAAPIVIDGELMMWTSELRITSILLTALGLLIATADRRYPAAAALVAGGGLLAANAALYRMQLTGVAGLRIALLLGAVAIVAGWAVAGRARNWPARRYVVVGVFTAAVAMPMVLLQGASGINHPYLPLGLKVTTVGLAVAGVLLAAVPAVVYARRRVPVPAAIALIGLPVVVTVVAAAIPAGTEEHATGSGAAGAALGLPLAVVTMALMRRHRSRARGRTAALWAAFTVAALPAAVVILVIGTLLFSFVPTALFAIEGGGYSHDGLSSVPGVAALILPIAVALAVRVDGESPVVAGPRWSPEVAA